MSDKMNDATCVAPAASVLTTSANSRRLGGATAAEASSQAERVMQVFRAAPMDAAAFTPVYAQCVSAAFLAAHPTELVVNDRLLWPAAPRFKVVFACVDNATAGEVLPDHMYGHPMLVHGPDTMPTYIATFIKDQCARLPADHAMHRLLDCVDDVAAQFAVHGALLAGLHEFRLWRALALPYVDITLRDSLCDSLRALTKALVGEPSPAASSKAEVEPPRISDTNALPAGLATVLKASEPTEADVSGSDDAASLAGEPLTPCTWWHFPSRWPSRALSELVRRGYSCCRLIKTSYDVAVFQGRDTASGQAVCIKVYDCKPVKMLETYSALVKTEVGDMFMSLIADFDTCVGYTVVARWEDGVTLDRTAKELRPVLTKAIADVVIRVNQAGFAHGDLHVRNVVLRPPAAGRSGGDDLRARLVLIDFDAVRMVKPCPGDWKGPVHHDKEGFRSIVRAWKYL